jgi:hypothetical protein
MKDQYYQYIKTNGIQDVLSWINEIPYSKKLHMLEDILSVFDKSVVNVALAKYEENYIKTHRVVPMLCRNILVSLCKMIQDKNKK